MATSTSSTAGRDDAPRHIVAVVAFDGISPFHLSVPCVVFGEDRSDGGLPDFDFRVCASRERRADHHRRLLDRRHAWTRSTRRRGHDHRAELARSERDATRRPARRTVRRPCTRRPAGRAVPWAPSCWPPQAFSTSGRRRPTGHGRTTSRAAFRACGSIPTCSYVDDGNVLTSAGTAAGLDCCLHVLRKMCGAQAANYVARRLVVPPHRQGGQAQYIQQPVAPNVRGDRLSCLLDWVSGNLDAPHTLDTLAERALMKPPHFSRGASGSPPARPSAHGC